MTRDDYDRLVRVMVEAASDLGFDLSAGPGGNGWTLKRSVAGSDPIHLPNAMAVAVLLEQREEAMVAAEANAAIQAAQVSAGGSTMIAAQTKPAMHSLLFDACRCRKQFLCLACRRWHRHAIAIQSRRAHWAATQPRLVARRSL